MTDYLVRLSVHSPGAEASGWVPADEVAVTGSISCRPFAPDINAARVHAEVPDRIILPEAFSVRLVNGECTLPLRPTDAWWCWEIREQTKGGRIRHLSVVDSALVVDYADAIDVDPVTLTPAAAAVPAWTAAVEAVQVLADAAALSAAEVPADVAAAVAAQVPPAVAASVAIQSTATPAGLAIITAADAATQRAALRAPRSTGALAHLDVTRLRAVHATAPLTTPTYDGSGQAVHPDVLVLESPWNGYRYWMAMTPYPNTVDTWENPSILASHDGETWVVPAGLTNPIDSPTSGFYPDPCLVMVGNTLWCIYASNKAKSSTDGVTWSARQTITFGDGAGGTKLSPSVLKVDDTFHYWSVDTAAAPNVLYHGTGASPIVYGNLTACTLIGGPVGRDLWHVAMRQVAGGYVGAFTYCDLNISGANAALHLASSPDGINWDVGVQPLLAPDVSVPWASGSVYRACLVPTDGTGGIWGRLWYSVNSATSGWRCAYTQLRIGAPESLPEMVRTDAVALHSQPVVIRGDARNRLPNADLLQPAPGNLVPLGWNNNLVGATGHAWYPEDESWSFEVATKSSRNVDRSITGLTLVEGETWTFSAEVRSQNAGGAQVVIISFYDGAGVMIGTNSQEYARSAEWKRIRVSKVVPAGAVSIKVNMTSAGDTVNPTRYWWRRVQLEKGEAPTAWTPGVATTVRIGGTGTDPALRVCGPIEATGSKLLWSITPEGAVALTKYTSAARPSAATVGEGAVIYDDTLNLPIVSDGTAWRNFTGTVV